MILVHFNPDLNDLYYARSKGGVILTTATKLRILSTF